MNNYPNILSSTNGSSGASVKDNIGEHDNVVCKETYTITDTRESSANEFIQDDKDPDQSQKKTGSIKQEPPIQNTSAKTDSTSTKRKDNLDFLGASGLLGGSGLPGLGSTGLPQLDKLKSLFESSEKGKDPITEYLKQFGKNDSSGPNNPVSQDPLDDPALFTYKKACMELFNIPFKRYKEYSTQDQKIKDMNKQQYLDYDIFCDIHTGFDILKDLIKYRIWCEQEKWDFLCINQDVKSTRELLDLNYLLPKSDKDLLMLFNTYPWVLDEFNEELFNIISLDTYELMLKLYGVNRLLYFNTFPESDDAAPILECESDVIELIVIVKCLVKKMLKHHIRIAKIIENKCTSAKKTKESATKTPAQEQPIVESAVDSPAQEQPIVESAVDTPAQEQSIVESAVDTPAQEQSIVESAVDTPAQEQPIVESAVDTPAQEQPIVESAVDSPAQN
jgi:hypothetical protein